jgi:PAP2 superfamily
MIKYWRTRKGWRLMKYKLATTLLVVAALVVATFSAATTTARPALAEDNFPIDGCPPGSIATKPPCDGDDVVLKWNEQLLETIRQDPSGTGPTVSSRALGVVHTAIYDAWSAYDSAKATLPNGNTEQPASEVSDANKSKAISFAAYETLVDLFPYREPVYASQMAALYGSTWASDTSAPVTVGKKAARAVINYRHADGSNQALPNAQGKVTYPCTPAGSTSPCFYKATKDWYQPTDQWRWQPLCVPLTATCKPPATNPGPMQQAPLTPQWGNIKPFASLTSLLYKIPPPPKTTADITTALADADLRGPDVDRKKVTAEYWADGPGSVFPPGHMAVFGQYLCRKRGINLDADVKFFFTLGNAVMDAGIASWWLKYKYDFWRPITAIRYQYKEQDVISWIGPNAPNTINGFGTVKGKYWKPYQADHVVTPPFPEYVSGHSTFSAAGNVVLVGFTGSDVFGGSIEIPVGWSSFEPGVPSEPVTLSWPTFTALANEAGTSRRYGGIHFRSGDSQGRSLGNMVGQNVWSKAQSYFKGTIGYNY